MTLMVPLAATCEMIPIRIAPTRSKDADDVGELSSGTKTMVLVRWFRSITEAKN